MIIHLTQTLVALDAAFLGKPAVCCSSRGKHFVAFLVRVGEFVLRIRPLDAVQRRHSDEGVSLFDQGTHVAEEQREQQGCDVLAVHVGIRHDDDLAVAQLRQIEILTNSGAESRDQGANRIRA